MTEAWEIDLRTALAHGLGACSSHGIGCRQGWLEIIVTDGHQTDYEALAEQAYAEMYDSRSAAACYNDVKYYLAQAIGAAERAGRTDEAARLTRRLEHCTAVYRGQFVVPGERPQSVYHPGRFRGVRYLRSSEWLVRACDLLLPVIPALATVCLSCAGMAFIVRPGTTRVLLLCAATLLGAVIFIIAAVVRR
ncbi:hypothetical protein JQ625_22315 [Bradyrhizobium diazoefficiens]|nr:hypothetical protein [Bradyrhizobium diazoefficiens]MBR0777576.1 hypothetical protein [Bradyrhizobium diazoefficiens]